MLASEERQKLIDRLTAAKITGSGAGHARLKNLLAIFEMQYGLERALLGFDELRTMPTEAVLAVVADINGCSRDIREIVGEGYISPKATLEGLIAAARILRATCRRRGNILLATGHPGSMLGFYLAIAEIITRLDGRLLTCGAGHELKKYRCKDCGLHDVSEQVDYVGPVAVVTNGDILLHTHDTRPLTAILAAAERRQQSVDLVVADHGLLARPPSAGCRLSPSWIPTTRPWRWRNSPATIFA